MLRLAYLVSQFPETHESFIVREIHAVTSQADIDLTIFSLKHCRDRFIQDEAKPFLERTRYPSVATSARGFGTVVTTAGGRRCVRDVIEAYGTKPRALLKAVGTLVRAAGILPALRALGTQHVHAHWATMPALAAYFLRQAAGVRYSITAHAWDIYADSTMLRQKVRAAEFLVTCTRTNGEHLRSIAGSENRIVVAYHGLDFAHVPSPRFERSGRFSILAVGRLVEQKGFSHLLKACSLLASKGRSFECRIIGDGPLRRTLQRELSSYGLDAAVTLNGSVRLSEVFDAYGRASAFCAPSVVAADGDRDGIPNVIIEAMSQGLPVVASQVSGIPEIVRHAVTGWLVPPSDPFSLALALEKVATGGAQVRSCAEAAYQLVRTEFDAQRNSRVLVELFRGAQPTGANCQPTSHRSV